MVSDPEYLLHSIAGFLQAGEAGQVPLSPAQLLSQSHDQDCYAMPRGKGPRPFQSKTPQANFRV